VEAVRAGPVPATTGPRGTAPRPRLTAQRNSAATWKDTFFCGREASRAA